MNERGDAANELEQICGQAVSLATIRKTSTEASALCARQQANIDSPLRNARYVLSTQTVKR